MSRQMDADREQRQARKDVKLVAAIEFDLVRAVERSGAVLGGYSVRVGGFDCLVTLRAKLAGKAQVAFVGAETPADALRKAVREGLSDKLVWRDDKYGT